MIKEEYRVEHHVLRNYFKKLNILFVESLKIDKEIFSFSFRKWIPIPGLQKPIDYYELQDRGRKILDALKEIQEDLSQMVFEREETNELVRIMHGYTVYSVRAQETLNTLCYRLYLKTEGIRDINNKEYEKLCRDYFLLEDKRTKRYSLQMDLIAQKLGFHVLQEEI